MQIVDQQLKKREEEKNPIKVGIIGVGAMGKGLLNQIENYTPGMKVLGMYNRTLEKAENTCKALGINDYLIAKSLKTFKEGDERNLPVLTNDLELFLECDQIEVVAEMTGSITFGLDTILTCFKMGKHVVSFNAELEATFGPYIREQAIKHGVKYSLGDGDQPGVVLNLYRQVKMMGFEPLVCGNIKGLQDHYRTPTTQAAFAKKWDQTPHMVTSFADGTKISCEQAVTANATNMTVLKRGMLGVESDQHVDNLTHHFDVDKLKELGGVVDYALGAKPGPGVYVYATTEDPFSAKYLKLGKLGNGPLYSFYVPYHLLFFEFAFSIARLVDFDDVTLDSEFGIKVEVIAVAKQDLKTGKKVDGLGGYDSFGVCEAAERSREDRLVPMGLLEDCTIIKDVKKDQAITMSDIELNGKSDLFDLYFSQFEMIKQL